MNLKKYLSIFFLSAWLLLFMSSICLHANGKLRIFGVDYSNFPTLKGKFFAFDNNGNPLKLVNNNLKLTDNSKEINSFLLNSPDVKLNKDKDILIVLDLATNPNLYNKDTLSSYNKMIFLSNILVENINSNSKIALSTFDQISYLHSELTKDKEFIKNQIQKIKSSQVSNLNIAFDSYPLGAKQIFDISDKSKKNIILITDRKANDNLDSNLAMLKNENIKCFVLQINSKIDLSLASLVVNSGGDYIDNIALNDDDSTVCYSIINSVYENKFSEFSLEAKQNCDQLHEINFEIIDQKINKSFTIPVNDSIKPAFEVSPQFVGFSSVVPSTSKEQKITITAKNTDINISRIKIENDNGGVFEISEGDITSIKKIAKNQSYTFTVKFSPKDSAIVFTKILLESDACFGNEILVTGGFPNTPPKVKNIRITAPNCSEILFVNDTFNVEWTGLLPKDVMQFQYSTDNGNTWDTLVKNVTDLHYNWIVPNKISRNCLVRAIQLWPNNIGKTYNFVHPAQVTSAFFSKDGEKMLTTCADGTIRIINSPNLKITDTLKGHTKSVNNAQFSPDGLLIASASDDNTAKIWNVTTGKMLYNLNKHSSAVNSVMFNSEGTMLATASKDGSCIVWNVATGDTIKKFIPTAKNTVNFACFSLETNSKYLLLASGANVDIWDISNLMTNKTATFVKTIKISVPNISFYFTNHISFSQDSKLLAVTDQSTGKVFIYDWPSGNQLRTVQHSTNKINSSSFHYYNKDSFLITSGLDNTAVQWKPSTGDSIAVFKEHTNAINYAVYNWDGSRVLTSSQDSIAKIWNLIDVSLQMDTSDCNFWIVSPDVNVSNVNFGNVLLSNPKDTIVQKIMISKSDFQIPIRKIYIDGQDASDFRLIGNELPLKIDSLSSIDLRIGLYSKTIGFKTADLVFQLPGKEIKLKLNANVVDPDLKYENKIIDFRNVEVGDVLDKTSEILLTNTLNALKIDTVNFSNPYYDNFTFINKNLPKVLAKGEGIKLSTRFMPDTIFRKNTAIEIYHSGNNSPSKILLYGQSILPRIDTATIYITPIQANPGNIIEAEIGLKNVSSLGIQSTISGFKTELSFDKSLLMPIGNFDKDQIIGNRRTISLSFPNVKLNSVNEKENEIQANDIVLGKIKFKAALGLDSMTTLILQNSSQIGLGKLKLFEENSIFNLTKLCREGTVRFFDDNGKLSLSQSYPNPSQNLAMINLEILEKGKNKLILYKQSGELVKVVFDQFMNTGNYSFEIDMSNLSSGVYFYKLITPTQEIVRNLIKE